MLVLVRVLVDVNLVVYVVAKPDDADDEVNGAGGKIALVDRDCSVLEELDDTVELDTTELAPLMVGVGDGGKIVGNAGSIVTDSPDAGSVGRVELDTSPCSTPSTSSRRSLTAWMKARRFCGRSDSPSCMS